MVCCAEKSSRRARDERCEWVCSGREMRSVVIIVREGGICRGVCVFRFVIREKVMVEGA